MDWKVIKTKAEYNKALKRTMAIFQAEHGTSESDELELLLVLIKDYEDKHIVLPEVDPIDAGPRFVHPLRAEGTDLEDGSETERLFSVAGRHLPAHDVVYTFGALQ